MPKITKIQARRRLIEARQKIKAVYMSQTTHPVAVTSQDLIAIEKIIDKCLKRLS
jgi:hypothetical protein